MTLLENLIGAWELTYYAEQLGPDGPITYPHGENPTGLIMYTPAVMGTASAWPQDRSPMTPGRQSRTRLIS